MVTILVETNENKVIKRVDIPLSDDHLQKIRENNQSLISVKTDLNVLEVKIIGNYKLENGQLIELSEVEKQSQEQQPSEIEQLKQSLLATQKFMIDFYTEMLMSIE